MEVCAYARQRARETSEVKIDTIKIQMERRGKGITNSKTNIAGNVRR